MSMLLLVVRHLRAHRLQLLLLQRRPGWYPILVSGAVLRVALRLGAARPQHRRAPVHVELPGLECKIRSGRDRNMSPYHSYFEFLNYQN